MPYNPDPKSYSPHGLNVIPVKDFEKAGQAYLTQMVSDSRKILDREGKYTGRDTTTTGIGYSSWTPVDESVWRQSKGEVKLVSTADYRVMPCSYVTLECVLRERLDDIVKFADAVFKGSDQVKFHFDRSAGYAGDATARMFRRYDGNYWTSYFKGKPVKNKFGQTVVLGGSSVATLEDNLVNFGIMDESGFINPEPDIKNSTIGQIYETNFKYMSDAHPDLLDRKDYVPSQRAVNVSVLVALASKLKEVTLADIPTFEETDSLRYVPIAAGDFRFNFATNSADFLPGAEAEMARLSLLVRTTEKCKIYIWGHTDSQGDAAYNKQLSDDRARAILFAVQDETGIRTPGRFETEGFGESRLLRNPERTEYDRSQNRRAEVRVYAPRVR